ncbi:MAG: MFS transporter [Candidatus Uhrbacteria bacterium]
MNRVTKLLLISDVFSVSGFGLIQPILAIFIKDNLLGGQIYAAGFASMLFLLTKSCVQLPFSRYVDKHHHSRRWLILGTVLITIVPFVYAFATRVEHIYLAEVLYGVGSGLAYPTWLGLWSKNLSKDHQSFEWSLYSTVTGLSVAAAAAIGAVLVQFIGFKPTFFVVGLLSLVGCLILFLLQTNDTKKAGTRIPKI